MKIEQREFGETKHGNKAQRRLSSVACLLVTYMNYLCVLLLAW